MTGWVCLEIVYAHFHDSTNMYFSSDQLSKAQIEIVMTILPIPVLIQKYDLAYRSRI